jgi:hypothetical protein
MRRRLVKDEKSGEIGGLPVDNAAGSPVLEVDAYDDVAGVNFLEREEEGGSSEAESRSLKRTERMGRTSRRPQ